MSFCTVFNGKRDIDVGVLTVRRPGIPVPELEVTQFTVPGRNGVLLSKIKRYQPITISVEFNFMAPSPNAWAESFRTAKRWFSGSGTLEFSDDNGWFYKVLNVTIPTSARESRRIGTFTAEFLCDPFTWARQGQFPKTIDQCKFNAMDDCEPLYHVTGAGAWTLTVNGNTMTGTGEAFVDVEKQVTYDASGNLINTSVTGNYSDLILGSGTNDIQITDGFTLEITPRWRSI